jgi:hypothetical protein
MSGDTVAHAAATRLERLVDASEGVTSTRARSAKVARLADALKHLDPT